MIGLLYRFFYKKNPRRFTLAGAAREIQTFPASLRSN